MLESDIKKDDDNMKSYLAKVTKKRQVTIPKVIGDILKLNDVNKNNVRKDECL